MAAPTETTSSGMRVVIAGGGTGGHLFPGIALAEEVRRHGGEVLFVGTERGIEARAVPEAGWPLECIEVVGIKGRGLAGLLRGSMRLPRAWLESRRILRRFAPDVVVGVGGYASGPIVGTAALMGLPTAILEQNSVPGVTNRILGRFVRRVFGTFPDTRGFFPARKLVLTGNPIRAELIDRLGQGTSPGDEAPDRPPRLFVFGGSQGARAINAAVVGALGEVRAAFPGLEVWHQTGKSEIESVERAYAEAGWLGPEVKVVSFIRDMSAPYSWCDLVLCRAGATSLAELATVGCPALLVPFPHAADNHQEHNARSLEEVGAARILLEQELSAQRLSRALVELLGDTAGLARMREAMRASARPGAAAEIHRGLREILP